MSKDLAKLKWIDPHLGDRMLDEIDDDVIDEIIKIKRDAPGRDGEGVTNATVNRYLALIRAILRQTGGSQMEMARASADDRAATRR